MVGKLAIPAIVAVISWSELHRLDRKKSDKSKELGDEIAKLSAKEDWLPKVGCANHKVDC